MDSREYSEVYHRGFMTAQAYLLGREAAGDENTPTGSVFPEWFAEKFVYNFIDVHTSYLSWCIMNTMDEAAQCP